MSTGTESLDAIAWVMPLLTGDSALMAACLGGVHLGVAPQGDLANPPVCVLWPQSSTEYLTFNSLRIWTDGTLLVKVSGPQGPATMLAAMRTVAGRVSALLSRATGGALGTSIISCVRTRDPLLVPDTALVNGVAWVSLVSLFRVLVL
jgi:hypothetical protein